MLDYAWIEDIKRGEHYRLLKTVAHVHLVFLTPPERRGGNLRLGFINWETHPDDDDVLLVPVVRANPEWHVLGPARYSVGLWMGPLPSSRTPSALIQFEASTRVSIYTYDDRIQQIVLLTADRRFV